ncbi:hypothetical protein [Secundilactobacillus silagei]|uniref:Uncharacterized protein n=1 Tax=Secundilactobacillus silagei JCM 19001 TaxID=1302250 RepID=A0A1Z5H4V8_9LACO|nr:hypothetical protein [Secundilactobacillus silagei]TDG70279.1 hypothetical protein C5L25_001469 [Secundilactobacillus silagei JCM 19001]GAT17949.1 hypothetical protein IWT126_00206 [Secundilactobacillus silagei JCM 19001]
MTALTIAGKTYPDLQIPDGYKIVVNKLVPRNDEKVHLLRYQPADLPEEALGREHVTVIYKDDGGIYSYNALTQPLTGAVPSEKQAFALAEKLWQEVAPKYREQLEPLRSLAGQERTYTDADGKAVTIPLIWAKYANMLVEGSYEWVGFGPNGHLVEFERYNFWDYEAGRQKTEMWYGDDWIRARRGLGPQLDAPLPLA